MYCPFNPASAGLFLSHRVRDTSARFISVIKRFKADWPSSRSISNSPRNAFFFFFSLHTKEEDQSILSHTNTGTFLQVSEMESKEGGENCTLYGVLKIIARTLMTVFSVGSSYGARRLFQKYSWDIDLAVKLCPGRAGPWFAAPEEGDEMLRHLEKWNCHWGWFTSWWAWQWGASAYSLQKFVIY